MFNVVALPESFMRQLKEFKKMLGPAISQGEKIPFADNDINYYLQLQHKRIADKGLTIDYELRNRYKEEKMNLYCNNRKDNYYNNFVYSDQLSIVRKFKLNGKKVFSDKRKNLVYMNVSDVISGEHPDNETYSCPNCGSVSTIFELQNGCPYCSAQYKMDDLFPKITSYYSIPDQSPNANDIQNGVIVWWIFCIILALCFAAFQDGIMPWTYVVMHPVFSVIIIPLLFIPSYFLSACMLLLRMMIVSLVSIITLTLSGKTGSIGSKGKFERMMKNITPGFSYDYFTSKTIALVKTAVFSENESELLFYNGEPLAPSFKNIIDLDYSALMKVRKITHKDNLVTVQTKMFFDNVLYAENNRVKAKRKVFYATFQRRTDVPINAHFSMTKISCHSCGGSFNAVQNRICPYCGNSYNLASDDWILTELTD